MAGELNIVREDTYGSKMDSSYIERIVMSNGDTCYIVAVMAGVDSAISCFPKQLENNSANDEIDKVINRLEKLEAISVKKK